MLFEPHFPIAVSDTEGNIDHNAYEEQSKMRRPLITLLKNIPVVVKVPYFIAASDSENFFYSLLLQNMPCRSETEILGGFDNGKEAFLTR